MLSALALTGALAGAQAGPLKRVETHKPSEIERAKLESLRSDRSRGFIENKGQWEKDALFLGRSNGLDVWVTKNGLRLDAYAHTASTLQGHVVDMRFAGAKRLVAHGRKAKTIRTDFVGHQESVENARTFEELRTEPLYPGITLRNYYQGARPRYDLILSPNADPSDIQLKFVGSNGLDVARQKLGIKTNLGTLFQSDLVAYQMIDGKKRVVPVAFKSLGKDTVGFKLGKYDRSKQLTIDPLVYGSYYGGDSGMDEVHAVAADLVGGVYMTGSTKAPDYPAIYGPYSFSLRGAQDAFVSKLEGDVYRHDYAVFLGGSKDDSGDFLQIDQFGQIWVAGLTSSNDFPGMDSGRANVQYLSFDTINSQGHNPNGTIAPTAYPNGNGHFRLILPGQGATGDILWNASPATVEAALNSALGTTGVQVESTGGAIYEGRGYKISLPNQFHGQLVVDNTNLGALYKMTTEGPSGRAQIIMPDPDGVAEPPTKGGFFIRVPYTRTGDPTQYIATTSVLAFNATMGQIKAALQNIKKDPADPNTGPVLPNVQVQGDFQTSVATDRLPGTGAVVLFNKVMPSMQLVASGANEIHRVNVSGATAGTFTLNPLNLGNTVALPFNASAAQVQAALVAVMGAGNVTVTSPAVGIYDVTYTGQYTNTDVALLVGNFTLLTAGVKTITEVQPGLEAADGSYSVVFPVIYNLFWDKTTSYPSGPEAVIGGQPNPPVYGGAVNLQFDDVFTGSALHYKANPLLVQQNVASASKPNDNIVMADDPSKTQLPDGRMSIIFVRRHLTQALDIPSFPKVFNDQVIVGSALGPAPASVVAEARLSPTAKYKISNEPNAFVMRFKQDASIELNPLPTKAFFFGGALSPALTGFRIIPHEVPTAGEPVRMAFSGNITSNLQYLPEISGTPRTDSAGFILRVNFTDASGFSIVPGATQYIDSSSYAVQVNGIDVDAGGNIYVGGTIFGDFANTIDTAQFPGVFQTTPVDLTGTLRDGRLLRFWDGFARKYSPTGALTYSVLVGGESRDQGSGIAVDQQGNAFLLGTSSSFNYPRTRGVFGEVFTQNYVMTTVKVNPAGTDLIFGTHLRTTNNAIPVGIAIDSRGNSYITGYVTRGTVINPWTVGEDPNLVQSFEGVGSVPTSGDALSAEYQQAEGGNDYGSTDGFLLSLNPSGTGLVYGSYLGSTLDEQVFRPYVDKFGDVWVSGWTDTFRAYLRPPRFARAGAAKFRVLTRLPATMLTELAFRPVPDPNIGLGGPGTQLLPDQLYNTEVDWDPVFLTSFRDRDGFVLRFRLGVTSVAKVTFNPSTVPGGLGARSSGVVTLSQAAPAGGAQVILTMSSSAPASFAPTTDNRKTTITIPEGATAGQFFVYTKGVTDNTPVDVTATYQGNFRVGRLVVVPWLQAFSITPEEVVGGEEAIARVQLSGVPGPGGVTVNLSSDTPGVVSVTQVTVPGGQSALSFPIATNGVDQDTVVTLNASMLGVGKAIQLTVHPAQLKSMSFEPNVVTSGSSTTGTLVLDGKAGPQGFDVQLGVVGGPSGYVITPNVLHFANGETSKTFTVATPYEAVTTPRVIRAMMVPTLGYSPNTVEASINVVATSVTGLTITPNTVDGGATATGQVTIGAPALAGGAKVSISVSPLNGTVTVPAQITIAEGQTTGSFQIKTSTLVNGATYTVKAFRGTSSASATLTVRALTFTVSAPAVITGGSSGSLTVTLSGAAPVGGVAVKLTSDKPTIIVVPDTVVIPAGSNSVTVPIKASSVTGNTLVNFTAKIGTVTHGASTTVIAAKVMGMTLNPSYVLNLYTTRCTLQLNGPAPAGGMVINLTSSNIMIANVPAKVTVPAGASSMSFSISTNRVTRTLATTITAKSANGGQAQALLTVHN